jgi:hypothetical protein
MAPLEAVPQEQRERTAVETRSGAVVALLLAFMTMAALAEVLASRAAITVETPGASTWARFLTIGDGARARGDASTARRAYLSALFRARGEHSMAGVLGAAERFTALGDREVVSHALLIAASLGVADGDVDTQRRLQALRDRLRASDAPPRTVRVPH